MKPKSQNYANHVRIVPVFHLFLIPLAILTLITAVVNVILSAIGGERVLDAALILALSLAVTMGVLFARIFANKAQDRAIRSEEKLRHFVLTGKLLDPRLTIGQIISLRFATDEEFPALCERALQEKLSPDAIKRAIKTWKADYDRV
jgi:FlaA1/EpsC-like NDP-sugar epimerase